MALSGVVPASSKADEQVGDSTIAPFQPWAEWAAEGIVG